MDKYRYIHALVMTQLLGLVTAIISAKHNKALTTIVARRRVINSVSALIVVLLTYFIDLIFYDFTLLKFVIFYFMVRELLAMAINLSKMDILVPQAVIKLANKMNKNNKNKPQSK